MARSGVPRGAWLAVGLLLLVGCRDATQIRLEIRTNVPCSKPADGWRGVAVYAGPPGAEERGDAPVLVTSDCNDQGYIGSLVVVPSGDKDEAVHVRVVAAISSDEGDELQPESCAARNFKGCIVARRAVRYVPHSTLELQIDLTKDCRNEGCDPEHSCFTGACFDVRDNAPAPASGLHTVHCGDNNAVCNVGSAKRDVCCLSVAADGKSSFGACMNPHDCPTGSVLLNCDDESDCDFLDEPSGQGMCVLSTTSADNHDYTPLTISNSQCLAPGHQFTNVSVALGLCQDRQPCNNNKAACIPSSRDPVNQLPAYFWCQLAVNQ